MGATCSVCGNFCECMHQQICENVSWDAFRCDVCCMCVLGKSNEDDEGEVQLSPSNNVLKMDGQQKVGEQPLTHLNNAYDTMDEKSTTAQNNEQAKNVIYKSIDDLLRSRYEKIKLPSLPWLHDVDIPIKKYTKLALELKSVRGNGTRESIELDNLFDAVDNKIPKRILIESQPGYGKTTLAHKIISDWVKEEKYVRHFKFAVLIILRDLERETLQSAVAQLISAKDWSVINNDETLLVLDGLDEISDETRKNVFEVLYDANNEYNMTIVTTSRIGSSKIKPEEIKSIFKSVSVQTDFWCKKIEILGINDENREEFLTNFVNDDNGGKIMPRLHEIIESRAEMFESPLLLILLIYVLQDIPQAEVKTNTDLYKNLVDCLVRRSVNKAYPETVDENFSLFDSSISDSSLIRDCKELFFKFGHMSLDHIFEDNLHFDTKDDAEKIHNLGFLLKHETRGMLSLRVHYEGFHLSILEFAAAFYFLEELRRNEYKFSVDLFKKFEKICLKRSSSLIFPFLSGLAGNIVSYLFGLFSLYRFSGWFDSNLINTVLDECSENVVVSDRISEFLPDYFRVHGEGERSEFFNLMDKFSFSSNLEINVRFLSKIQSVINAKFLRINVWDDDVKEGIELNAEKIQCDIVSLKIEVKQVISYIDMAELLKSFFNISSSKKEIFIYVLNIDNYLNLEKCIENGIFRDKDLDYLFVSLEEWGKHAITRIVENNRVERVELVFRSHVELNFATDIVYNVAKSNYTSSFWVRNCNDRELRLDLDAITQSGAKKWKVLRFDNVEVESKMSLNGNSRISSLVIIDTRNYENWLFSIASSRLECDSDVLKSLHADERSRDWEGWHSMVELELTIKRVEGEKFNYCSKFTRLDKLTFNVRENIVQPDLHSDEICNVIQSLSANKLDQLLIRFQRMEYSIADTYISKVMYSLRRKELECVKNVTFEFVSEFANDLVEFDVDLVKYHLRDNSKAIIRFAFATYLQMTKFVTINLFRLLSFNVEYSLATYDFTVDRTMYHQLQLTLN